MPGRDAGRENSISETRQKAEAWAGGGTGHAGIVKTPLYQCCIPRRVSQNGHRAYLIPANCSRPSVAAGLWTGWGTALCLGLRISLIGSVSSAGTAVLEVPWKNKGTWA